MLLIGFNNYSLSKFRKSDVLGCVGRGRSGEAACRAGTVLTHEVTPS